jgi:hypothetical protein
MMLNELADIVRCLRGREIWNLLRRGGRLCKEEMGG